MWTIAFYPCFLNAVQKMTFGSYFCSIKQTFCSIKQCGKSFSGNNLFHSIVIWDKTT